MARIAGVDLPNNKRIDIALRSIYGVGPAVSRRIVELARLDPKMKAGDLDPNQVNEIRKALDRYAGNVSHAAAALGLSRSALYRRLERHGL